MEERISKDVYYVIRKIVGTSEGVAIKRDTMDARDFLHGNGGSDIFGLEITFALSGSFGEGFRFDDSDIDVMVAAKNINVIWNLGQNKKPYNKTSFMFDSSEMPPGYGLIQILTKKDEKLLKFMLCKINGKSYLSNQICRRIFVSKKNGTWISGPSIALMEGHVQLEQACCLISDSWPPSAFSFFNRSQSWPKPRVLHDIYRSGFTFCSDRSQTWI